MSGPVERATLATLAISRLDEARCLLDRRLWSGAYYLGGYSVEFAFKACIARQFGAEQIPDPKLARAVFTHSLVELLSLSGLSDVQKRTADDNAEFDKNWAIVRNWKEDSRYQLILEDHAKALVDAVGDPEHGVLKWIQRHW